MKIKLCIVLFLSIFISLKQSFAQAPNWQWAKATGGADDENGNNITTDLNGNVLVTGYFYSPTITFGTYTLTNAGNYDIFIVKYDPSGNVLWAKSAGGIYDDIGYGICTDFSGNIFVTGHYYSPSITLGSYTLTNSGGGDVFIVKYDPSGNELWTKKEGGTLDDNSFSMTADNSGNILVTGLFQSSTLISGNYTLTNTGGDDVFVIKYDGSGNTLWAKSGDGSLNDQGNAIATDANGNVYLAGSFYSSSIIFDTFTLTALGGGDAFVIKYSNTGNAVWAKSVGGTFNDSGNGIITDGGGDIYMTGSFLSSTINIGPSTFTNAGSFDIFIVKYDTFGNEVWAKSEGGIFDDTGLGIETDISGNIYVTGHFHSPSIVLGVYTLTNTGIGDVYVTKYNNLGNIIWAKGTGGTADDGCASVSVDAGGNVFVTGYFFSPTITFTNTTITNMGSGDMFVAKLENNIMTGFVDKLINSDYKINIYPNPSNGMFYITSNEFEVNSVEVYNAIGGKIYQAKKLELNDSLIDISNQPKGIYFVNIKTDKGIFLQKIISI